MRGSSRRKSTVGAEPWIMLKTPSGRPASLASSAIMRAAPGLVISISLLKFILLKPKRLVVMTYSRSEGFMTTVFPVMIAGGRHHRGIIAGKLKGQIAATTPYKLIISQLKNKPLKFFKSI